MKTNQPNCPRCDAPWKEFRVGSLNVATWDCPDENCGKPAPAPREPEWKIRIPALYQNAVVEKVRQELRPVLEWDARGAGNGMAIQGPSRVGKSFAVALAARKWPSFRWMNGRAKLMKVYGGLTSDNHEDKVAAWNTWGMWEAIPILIIDDLDKANWTPEFSNRFYGLLEARLNAKLKTVWTANTLPPSLRMQDGTPDALGNRLVADCLAITLTK